MEGSDTQRSSKDKYSFSDVISESQRSYGVTFFCSQPFIIKVKVSGDTCQHSTWTKSISQINKYNQADVTREAVRFTLLHNLKQKSEVS